MKVIELLNKINKGEEVPEKVKFEGDIFTYKPNKKEYERKLSEWVSETLLFKITNEHTHFIQDLLKAEVEVIEENKEIEELDEMQTINARPEVNAKKINELVRAVNKINKQLEEQETEDIDTVERELNKMF